MGRARIGGVLRGFPCGLIGVRHRPFCRSWDPGFGSGLVGLVGICFEGESGGDGFGLRCQAVAFGFPPPLSCIPNNILTDGVGQGLLDFWTFGLFCEFLG